MPAQRFGCSSKGAKAVVNGAPGFFATDNTGQEKAVTPQFSAIKKPPPKQGPLTFSADGFVWLELILQWNVHFRNTIGSCQIFRKHRCAAILQNSILEKIHCVAVDQSDVSLANDL